MEDAIAAAGVNTDERKYLKVGINTDAQSWYLEDLAKYEWDGPKVQYDTDQLIEFYEKLCSDHPLLELIEDGFAGPDIQGYRKCIDKFARERPEVFVGVCSLFDSNLDRIREFTQMIAIDSDEDEAAEEKKEGEEVPEDQRASPAPEAVPEKESKPDPKEAKKPDKPEKGLKGKKASTQEEAPPVEVVDPNKKPDPNANKFIPGAIHLRRELLPTTHQLQ